MMIDMRLARGGDAPKGNLFVNGYFIIVSNVQIQYLYPNDTCDVDLR